MRQTLSTLGTRATRAAAAGALVCLMAPAQAVAGELTLQIRDGIVTLRARDVTAREILSEWARVGQTRVVNGDRIPGGPITLELTGVPERQALDVILRSASGYMAARRPAATAGASVFDRILVLPTSTPAPAAASTAPFGAVPRPAAPPPNIFTPSPQPDTADVGIEPDDQEAPQGMAPVIGPNGQPARFFPAGPNRGFRPGDAVQAPAFIGAPGGLPQEADQPEEPAAPPQTTSPFGIPSGTSAVPGVVIQPPQQPQGNRR